MGAKKQDDSTVANADKAKVPEIKKPEVKTKETKPEKKKGGNKLAWFVFLMLIVGAGYYWQADVLRYIDLIRQVNAAGASAQKPVTQGYIELPKPENDPNAKSFVIEVGPEPSRILTEINTIPGIVDVSVRPVDGDPRKQVKIIAAGSNYNSSCKDNKNSDCWIGADTPMKDARVRLISTSGGRFPALVTYAPKKKK